jgi:hypothetical protein
VWGSSRDFGFTLPAGKTLQEMLRPTPKKSVDAPVQIRLFGKLKLTKCAPVPGLPAIGFFMGAVRDAAGHASGRKSQMIDRADRRRVRNRSLEHVGATSIGAPNPGSTGAECLFFFVVVYKLTSVECTPAVRHGRLARGG